MKTKIIIDAQGNRVHRIVPEPVPEKKVTKAAQKRELAAKVGKGLSKTRGKYTKPSAPVITTFKE